MNGTHPLSTTFWTMAVSHEEAALHLEAKMDRPGYYCYMPIHSVLFLFYRSIELALKAYLLSHGMTVQELRSTKKFGHQIDKLYAETKNRNILSILSLTQEEIEILTSLSRHYSSKSYEYPEHMWVEEKPPLQVLKRLCRKVVFALEAIFDGPELRNSERYIKESAERRASG